MAKQFKSIKEAVSYIKSAQRRSSREIGLEVEKVMKETTQKNLYDAYSPEEYERTYDMINMIGITESSVDSVTVAFQDKGGHTSWNDPKPHVYVAPILEEGGHTWERDGGRKAPTNIVEDSYEIARDTVPETYIKSMAVSGIKVKKR